jgi:DNA-binding IclR family transcriptional regulator
MNRISVALRALGTTDDKIAALDAFLRSSPTTTADAWAANLRCDVADAKRLLKTLVAVGYAHVAHDGRVSLTLAGIRTVARIRRQPVALL